MSPLRFFGTDGIRGLAGQEPMTEAFARRLGYASARVLGAGQQAPLFLIGRDTRVSGPALQEALSDGLQRAGAVTMDLGILPTPGIAYLTAHLQACAGAVISASHNPADENGIKFLTSSGMKLSEADEMAIEALLEKDEPLPTCLTGYACDNQDTYARYKADLLASVAPLKLDGMKILLDCSNGAAWQIAPDVLRSLGAEVIALNTEHDGRNINLHCGSESLRSNPALLAESLRASGAQLALAFDGDADRVIMMDEDGNLIDGDHMLAILADDYHAHGKLLGNALVTTVMANGGLHAYAHDRGFTLQETPVGDKYVTEALLSFASSDSSTCAIGVGGEQSGHIILMDADHRTGDGLRTGLAMLKIVRNSPTQKLSALTGAVAKFPQLVASCRVDEKIPLESLAPLQEKLAQLSQELPGLVRVNSRYSGTEAKYRLMLETDTRHSAADVARQAWTICELVQTLTHTKAGAKIEVLNVAEGGLMPRKIE